MHAELPQKFHAIAGLPFFDLFPQAPFVGEDLVGLACRFNKNGVSRDHAGANEKNLAAVLARISCVLRTKKPGILFAEGFVRDSQFLGAVVLVGAWIFRTETRCLVSILHRAKTRCDRKMVARTPASESCVGPALRQVQRCHGIHAGQHDAREGSVHILDSVLIVEARGEDFLHERAPESAVVVRPPLVGREFIPEIVE